jgi:hypothetical protein
MRVRTQHKLTEHEHLVGHAAGVESLGLKVTLIFHSARHISVQFHTAYSLGIQLPILFQSMEADNLMASAICLIVLILAQCQ